LEKLCRGLPIIPGKGSVENQWMEGCTTSNDDVDALRKGKFLATNGDQRWYTRPVAVTSLRYPNLADVPDLKRWDKKI
jgi:hypothetical protein